MSAAARIVIVLRRLLLLTLVLGVVGISAELLLIEHTEPFWQLVPLILLGLATVALIVRFVAPKRGSIRALQVVMLLCIAAGVGGGWLHYDGNAEFELEMDAFLEGLELFEESMTGATPVLAPGAMIQIGLVGLAYCFRHPLTAK